jgi:hypothetical protein
MIEQLIALLGITPEQANAILAGLAAGLLVKGIDLALVLAAKLAGKTKTDKDDLLVKAIADAVHAKIRK